MDSREDFLVPVLYSQWRAILSNVSVDMALGVPFNIASYALLTSMIAHVCDLIPGDFVRVIGDGYVHDNLIRVLQEQLIQQRPKAFPILRINPEKDIVSFVASDFELVGYNLHKIGDENGCPEF
ncbi:bifunctional dihydrofolate reductase-thymidylate synthase 2-like [Pistacia vera]|uniref:bifunctional dihydrofolate reductase-thymidylate synthase 2-like n=1 Tax=Pistacia vera TaxID=55513 RepID=UPI0012635C33|nr:bifunctional dihydrofolate reductase-thymidylate synthase 2-like [Pistacia vera]